MKKLLLVLFFLLIFPGSISAQEACTFTKGDQNPPSLPYKSNRLLEYFKEVSEKTGVPFAVLAGIARVESTTSTYTISNYTDEDISYIESFDITKDRDAKIPNSKKAVCPKSPTGASGIMQIQPSGTIGHDSEAVNNGARFISKTGDALSISDYCNPKSSIYLAAGFVLKKLERLGIGDGQRWDPDWTNNPEVINQVAKSYYGCLKYPSCQNGPYSYGDDLVKSIQACQNFTPISSQSQTTTGSSGKSNLFCTKVGEPTEPMPAICKQPSGDKLPPGSSGTGPIGFSVSCPLGSDYSISCGTAANPIGGRCGHGGVGYGACSAPPYAVCPYSPALKASIDVVLSSGNAAGAKVFMPYINGKESITWVKQQGPVAIPGEDWGYKFIFTGVYNGKNLILDLTHVNPSVTADVLQSGDHVTSVYSGTDGPGRGHLHTALSVDGVWVEPGQDALMCAY